MNEYRVNQGGLMRCCLQSLGDYIDEHEGEAIPDGTIISCKWCKSTSSRMILEGHTWRWMREDHFPDEA